MNSKREFTLAAVKNVEHVLKHMPDSLITIRDLKKALPKNFNRAMLGPVLATLDVQNKIYMASGKITWIYSDSKKLKRAIAAGTPYEILSKEARKYI